jgi:hypothetical protein
MLLKGMLLPGYCHAMIGSFSFLEQNDGKKQYLQ